MNVLLGAMARVARRWHRRGAAALLAAGVLALAQTAQAATPRADLLSGGAWMASENGVDGWIPAYAPFPNPISRPNPYLNPLGVHAELMWYWAGPGQPQAFSGPGTAYFRREFTLPPGPLPQIVALVAADDHMTLRVNGVTIGTYNLADHRMPNDQAEVVAMDLTPALRQGANQIDIEARDDLLYHWVFFDTYNLGASRRSVIVPMAPERVELIGDKDDFHAGDGADVPPRSQHVLDLLAALVAAPSIDLDESVLNQSVGLTHSATLPDGALITSATVKLRVKMTGDLIDNDVILFNQSAVPPVGEASRVVALQDLLGFPPEYGAVYELKWNLAKTPLRNFSASVVTGQPDQVLNLLPMLVGDGRVDVVLADDTMVDYSELIITYTVASAAPGDLNNDALIDRDDLAILLLGLNTTASGPDDPRDLDRDGRITALDVRKLVAGCTLALCGK
nr:hypothetical protein [uncultured Duganella sp.]